MPTPRVPTFLLEASRSTGLVPGVYIFRNEAGAVIYVGMSGNLRRRLASYVRPHKGRRGRKARKISGLAHSIELRQTPTAAHARRLEIQLIQELKPTLNVDGAFSFLYPFIGLRCGKSGEVDVCFTTHDVTETREGLEDFQFFGAFRGLSECREAFNALSTVLEFIGHGSRPAVRGKKFVTVKSFRLIPAVLAKALRGYLAGLEPQGFLAEAFSSLLAKASARTQAADLEKALKTLRDFSTIHLQSHRRAMQSSGMGEGLVAQTKRDLLYIPTSHAE